LFGTKTIWFGSRTAEVADPHRLLIDILDLPELGGGGRHMVDIVRAYWKSSQRDPKTLMDYAKRYGRGSVFKRMGFTAELFRNVDAEWLEECRSHASSSVIRLDPAAPARGRIVTRWGLQINIPVDPS
jgi:predicted transcriptional regulator of viral defense system